MHNVKLNEYKIIFDRIIDIIARGNNCLVYDYWGRILPLENCVIWYNNKWKYVKPKNYKIKKTKKNKKNKKKKKFFI